MRALYEQYLAQLSKAGAQPEQYYRYFNALSWFSDPSLVKRTLEFAMSSDVRSQDASTLIGSLLVHAVVERHGLGVHEDAVADAAEDARTSSRRSPTSSGRSARSAR